MRLFLTGAIGISLVLLAYGDITCKEGFVCKSFTYTLNNKLVQPYFTNNIVLEIEDQKPFQWYMEKACKNQPTNFKTFTATYYQEYGYYVEAVNYIYGNWKGKQTYWEFSNATFGPLDVGVSYYVPSPGDSVTLDFTQSASPSTVWYNGKRP